MQILSPSRITLLLAYLFIAFAFNGCSLQPASDTQEIVKSANDDRDYQWLALDNGLEVLLVSDAAADTAAASLDIHVGSSDDPQQFQGLAHFLEHMLFLGTEKYPETGEYQQFITDHGGSHNAYTANENTNYFFEIKPDAFDQALDRFSQFFISPLFNQEYVEREKNAVNAEYQLKYKDDSRRFYDVLKEIINQDHPLAKFSVGSLDTLTDQPDISLQQALIDFYRQHYSAQQMKLVVIGPYSLDNLADMVTSRFNEIPDFPVATEQTVPALYQTGDLPMRVNIEPVKDVHQLILQFPVPPTHEYYQSKPLVYLSNLLGDEGQGSLFATLKAKGWAESLSAGEGLSGDRYATFQITIELSPLGMEHIDEITSSVLSAIDLVASQGIDEWRFNELAQLQELAFRFQEKGNQMHYATLLASRLQDFTARDVLTGPYNLTRYDPELIRRYLSYLTPDNLMMAVIAKELPVDQVSYWHQAPYSVEKLGQDWVAKISQPGSDVLSLPSPNPFIPEDVSILSQQGTPEVPQKILDSPGLTLWHSLDTSFGTPKADFYFAVRSPLASDSPRDAVLTRLYVKAVKDELNEFSYPAYLAGLDYQLYNHIRGFTVRISGYQDKQPLLLKRIAEVLTEPALNSERFELNKADLIRELENASQDRPYNQAVDWVSKLLLPAQWSETDMLAALQNIRHQDLKQFAAMFLQHIEIVALANGNIDRQQALAMTEPLNELFQPEQRHIQVPRAPVARIKAGKSMVLPIRPPYSDSALVSYYQGPDKSMESRAAFALLQQVIDTPYYQELRTRQQLGYLVSASPLTMLDVPALAFIIQSPNTSADELQEKTHSFLEEFRHQLEGLTEAELNQQKRALVSRIMEKDLKLSDRSNRYWTEIDRGNTRFDTREQLEMAISRIDKDRLLKAYDQFLLDPGKMRNLRVYAMGENSPPPPPFRDNETLVDDDKMFKREGDFF